MCLILLAHGAHAEYPLVLAANRDEFYDRPTAPAAFRADAPHVLAGRDLRAGGTWMGVTRSGRWAALTNYREGAAEPATDAVSSRGEIVREFLVGSDAPDAFLRRLQPRAHEYSGFNLLVGEGGRVLYFGSRGGDPRELPSGIYGLSNDLLDTPWPKVRRGKDALRRLLSRDLSPRPAYLLELLADAEFPPDSELPDTGVGREWERMLAPLFINTPAYGTRSSTALLIGRAGSATMVERSFLPGRVAAGEVHFEFTAHRAEHHVPR
ncbi:NRDE family protein [soil metagenome]|nr:NRDE family protein [Gemmatimonadota bacterium]